MTTPKERTMTPLRKRMIDDMTLAGLAPRTQDVDIQAVRGLAGHYRRSPDRISEEEVRRYLLGLRDRGATRGTFKTAHYGLQFLYRQTGACQSVGGSERSATTADRQTSSKGLL